MAKFLYIYHGGKKPDSQEEIDKIMQEWGAWFGSMGDAVVDGGNPVGLSHTVISDGSIVDNGGSNPVSGYSIVTADSQDNATRMAQECPILKSGGSVEVAEIINM